MTQTPAFLNHDKYKMIITMKIAILSRNKQRYSSRCLIEACEQRDHEPVVLDALRTYMDVTSNKADAHFKGTLLPKFDAIIPRLGNILWHGGTQTV